MKSIEVIVDAEGAVSLQIKGFNGQGCKSASEVLEKALGAKLSDKATAEAFAAAATNKLVQ